jgi:hypothetical protein
MARPVYPHELCDPDFQWLISNYKETHPNTVTIESTFLPLILIQMAEAIEAVETLSLPEPEIEDAQDIDEP